MNVNISEKSSKQGGKSGALIENEKLTQLRLDMAVRIAQRIVRGYLGRIRAKLQAVKLNRNNSLYFSDADFWETISKTRLFSNMR